MTEVLRTLAATDLNLLVSLAALLEERHVSRAAKRVGISQPAMSRCLSRLRVVFDDGLLQRHGRGMALTARGQELALALPGLLQRIGALYRQNTPFDVEQVRIFRIAMTDYASVVLLPPLQRMLAQAAPHAALHVLPMVGWADVEPRLAQGQLDAAIGFGHNLPPRLSSAVLFQDRFVCVTRRRHPRIRKRLTLRQYTTIAHLLVSQRGRVTGAVDVALAQHGLTREVGLVVPHFLVAPALVGQSDYVATLASRVVDHCGQHLQRHPPPVQVSPFQVVVAMHPLQRNSAASSWLWSLLLQAAAEV